MIIVPLAFNYPVYMKTLVVFVHFNHISFPDIPQIINSEQILKADKSHHL
jgi:hypothetical protein